MNFSARAAAAAAFAMAVSVWPVFAHAGDPGAGQTVFKTQCGICHSTVQGKNMIGPSLFGILGRESGSVDGFRYSPANKGAKITWTAATLDKYLIAPRATVPGTTMTFAGLKDDAKRADLVTYLETLR